MVMTQEQPITKDKLRCPSCEVGSTLITVRNHEASCLNCAHIWPVMIVEPKILGKCPEQGSRAGKCHLPVKELNDRYGVCPRCGPIPRAEILRPDTPANP